MGVFDQLVRDIQACSQGEFCRNSPGLAGIQRSKCSSCRLSPGNEEYPSQHWNPTSPKILHPQLEQEKRAKRIAKSQEKVTIRRAKDKGRQRVLKQAVLAEKSTERNIIKATKNSGRSFRDGDHVSMESITLDTKLQSLRDNPVVLLYELDKVRKDAVRAGFAIGGLVLRNKNDVGVVVLHEDDYAKLTTMLTKAESPDESET